MNGCDFFLPRAAVVTGAFLFCIGCQGGSSSAPQAHAPAPDRDPLSITVSEALLGQLQIGEPAWAEVAGSLRVPGRVEADETRIAMVNSPIAGRIVDLEVVEGQPVKRGQVIAVIRSTELSNAQSDFLKSLSQQALAQRAVDRARLLLDAGVIGEAELQRREAELVQVNTDVNASRDQLRVLGMSEQAIDQLQATRAVNSVAQVLASIDGTVLERKATIGQVVQAAEAVCVLADLSKVWLVADVPEQAAGNMEVGKTAEAEISAFPGQVVSGRLSFVSSTVNRETATVRVRMDLANPHGRYKPAMLATMLLRDSSERQRVVPVTAVVRESNRDFVFVQTAARVFKLRPVTLGETFDGRVVLAAGWRPGERVVLDGAFHLNNERNRLALQGQ